MPADNAAPAPRQNQSRTGIALALSGGGYRAMLFHTGVLIRLNELGLLKQVTRFSSVSGGSISAGFLGLVWNKLDWQGGVAMNLREVYVDPILAFSRKTIDRPCGTVGFLTQGLLVSRLVTWFYDRALFHGATLKDLPDERKGDPRFVICATNLTTGSLWRFARVYMADYRLGLIKEPDFSLARAVAASSAFPPVLSPMRLNLRRFRFEPDAEADERELAPPVPDFARRRAVLTDGGAYDNHGLEPVIRWPTLLVSDGGAPHALRSGIFWNWYKQLRRVLDVEDNQVRAQRRRTLIARFENRKAFADCNIKEDHPIYRANACQGTYWSIATNPDVYPKGNLDCPADAVAKLAHVGTRLKDYGDPVRNALVNWGYAICDKSVRHWYRPDLPEATKWPMPGGVVT